MPLINTLFPGINYYSITGFNQVMTDYVRPVLSKLFPEIKEKDVNEVDSRKRVEVKEFLHTKGYEHCDNKWKKDLESLLSQ